MQECIARYAPSCSIPIGRLAKSRQILQEMSGHLMVSGSTHGYCVGHRQKHALVLGWNNEN